MLTSKQRAYLRGLANGMETILIIGKGEITDNVIMQADTALTARELIKGRVLENSAYSSREAADSIAEKCSADVVLKWAEELRLQLVPKRNMFRFPNSELTETEAGSEVQIATLPADQQEPAKQEWEKVLRPFKRREPWL